MEVFNMLPEGTLAEVINNTIYMPPAPTFSHQVLNLDIAVEIRNFMKGKEIGECVVAHADVYLDDNNAVQPDLLFISKDNLGIIKNDKIKGVPNLVIEVLSQNRKYDLKDKKNLYETFGVKEYFIVDPSTKDVITYYHNGEKYIQQDSSSGKIKSEILQAALNF